MRLTFPALAATLVLAACGGGDTERARAQRQAAAAAVPTCRPAGEAAVGPAVLRYVDSLRPTPRRFLVAAGTDSGLPDAGVRALQKKGPTYLYPPDPALQAQVRARLADVGDEYPSLLVSLREARETAAGQSLVRLRGVYVGGEHDGRPAPGRTLYLACDSTGWTVRRAAEETSA